MAPQMHGGEDSHGRDESFGVNHMDRIGASLQISRMGFLKNIFIVLKYT